MPLELSRLREIEHIMIYNMSDLTASLYLTYQLGHLGPEVTSPAGQWRWGEGGAESVWHLTQDQESILHFHLNQNVQE